MKRKVLFWPSKDKLPPKNLPRNAKCPCGSGKKYKNCHGQLLANKLQEKTIEANN